MNKQLLQLLANRPLMMLPGAVEVLASMSPEIMGEGAEIPSPEMISSNNLNSGAPLTAAIIPISGALRHKSSGFLSWLYSSMSYDRIRKMFSEALTDESIDAIIFDIDSPGGDVAGCFDLVDEIHEARGKKPVCAIANEFIFSAAYAIASATDSIYIPRTGQVGSIGVISVHIDESKRDEMEGVSYTSIFAGERKNDFSRHSKLSEEAQLRAQDSVDKTYSLFVESVSRNRGVAMDKISGTEAGIFTGQDAVDNGLADYVMSRKEAINHILVNLNRKKNKGGLMGLKEDLGKLLSGDEGVQALKDLGFEKKVEEEPVKKEETETTVTTATTEVSSGPSYEDALAITELCEIAGCPQMVSGLLEKKVGVDEARKLIIKAKADGDFVVNSTVTPTSTGEVNPFIAACSEIAGSGGN